MSLQPKVLIDQVAITGETVVAFSLAGHQVPATLSCKGVAAAGEDIEIQKLVSGDDLNDAAAGDFQTIVESGTNQVLNADNNSVAIYGPGRYRIKTADVVYASGDVTVVLDF